MKGMKLFFTIGLLAFGFTCTYAQKSPVLQNATFKELVSAPMIPSGGMHKTQVDSALINFPDSMTYMVYLASGYGFLFGHNNFESLGLSPRMAEKYNTNASQVGANMYVKSIVTYNYGYLSGTTNDSVNYRVFTVSPVTYTPEIALGGKKIAYNDLAVEFIPGVSTLNDVANFADLTTPIAVDDSFFVTFELMNFNSADTLSLWSKRFGARPATDGYGRNCVVYNNNWVDYLDINASIETSLAIVPVVDFTTSNPNLYIAKNDLKLYPAFPNPSAGHTTIKFDLANAGNLEIAVYDVNGRIVSKQLLNNLSSGEHTHTIDTHTFAPGSYNYIISSEAAYLGGSFIVSQ